MRGRKRIEEAIGSDEKIGALTSDLDTLFELAREGERMEGEIAQALKPYSELLERLETEMLLSGENDSKSAIVTIHPEERPVDAFCAPEVAVGIPAYTVGTHAGRGEAANSGTVFRVHDIDGGGWGHRDEQLAQLRHRGATGVAKGDRLRLRVDDQQRRQGADRKLRQELRVLSLFRVDGEPDKLSGIPLERLVRECKGAHRAARVSPRCPRVDKERNILRLRASERLRVVVLDEGEDFSGKGR